MSDVRAKVIVGGIAKKINEAVGEPVNRGDHTPEDLGRGYVNVAEAEAVKAAAKAKDDAVRAAARKRGDEFRKTQDVEAKAEAAEDEKRRKKKASEPKVFRNEDI